MADNTGSWMDFAQRSRDDGGLGLAPHQAAGLVGNLQNESGSGIPAWGPTGDNGSAWGSAQWRGDRLQALKDHADENDLDYRTPEAQQSFMRQEFDTTHNGAYKALQAATTPEEAANVVNRQYEISADNSGRRAQSARALFDGSDGPTAIETAMGRKPATGSQAMAYTDPTQTPGALTNPGQPQGALTAGGTPVDTSTPQWAQILQKVGQTMAEMAPGIAQDPAHAAALEQVAAAGRQPQGTWSTNFDPITGMATQTNSSNPSQTRQFKYAAPRTDPNDKEKWSVIGKDRFGQPIMGFPPTPEEYAASKAAAPAPDPAAETSGLSGKEFMDAITKSQGPQYANSVQAIVDGRALMPNSSSRQPGAAQLRADALQADPTLQEGTGPARVKLRQAYTTSTAPNSPAVQMRMGNVALEHGANLSDEIEAVKAYNDHADSSIPGVSYGLNFAHNKTLAGQSTPEAQAYTSLQTHINNFASEKAKFLGGGVAGEHEKARILALYDMNKSLPELRASMAADAEDVMAKHGELQNGWRTGNDNSPLVPDFPVVTKEGQAGYDRIIARHNQTKDGGYVQPSGVKSSTPSPTPSTSKPMKTSNGVSWSIN
jgi:hypothetical protein